MQLDTKRFAELSIQERDIVWAAVEWSVLVWSDGQLVSHVGIVTRDVKVNGLAVHIGGIGGVMTHPDSRRRGFANAEMQKATRHLGCWCAHRMWSRSMRISVGAGLPEGCWSNSVARRWNTRQARRCSWRCASVVRRVERLSYLDCRGERRASLSLRERVAEGRVRESIYETTPIRIPSSGAARHLLPEGEGFSPNPYSTVQTQIPAYQE